VYDRCIEAGGLASFAILPRTSEAANYGDGQTRQRIQFSSLYILVFLLCLFLSRFCLFVSSFVLHFAFSNSLFCLLATSTKAQTKVKVAFKS
jgi:hypothetical protein